MQLTLCYLKYFNINQPITNVYYPSKSAFIVKKMNPHYNLYDLVYFFNLNGL